MAAAGCTTAGTHWPRGDVTITAMVGALADGLAALGLFVVRRDVQATLPYGPSLCLGGLLSLVVHP